MRMYRLCQFPMLLLRRFLMLPLQIFPIKISRLLVLPFLQMKGVQFPLLFLWMMLLLGSLTLTWRVVFLIRVLRCSTLARPWDRGFSSLGDALIADVARAHALHVRKPHPLGVGTMLHVLRAWEAIEMPCWRRVSSPPWGARAGCRSHVISSPPQADSAADRFRPGLNTRGVGPALSGTRGGPDRSVALPEAGALVLVRGEVGLASPSLHRDPSATAVWTPKPTFTGLEAQPHLLPAAPLSLVVRSPHVLLASQIASTSAASALVPSLPVPAPLPPPLPFPRPALWTNFRMSLPSHSLPPALLGRSKSMGLALLGALVASP
ncbi:hypothetical protein Cni_G09170 [Canna indica]|uniref:Uncharacterized protein n=1 Tax=Canna indica TaxID=4628 RepID=A0AAQ3K209_9LILI|nr:hypothetical protein Cni_G09170 [Canna indica]